MSHKINLNKQKTIFFLICLLSLKDVKHLNLVPNLKKIVLFHDQFLGSVSHFFCSTKLNKEKKAPIN